MPLNVGVQEGHVALIEVVSNEEWKEYNMKHRAITLAFAACFLTSLALASDTLTFDSSRSNAQLFQGSKANSDSVNTGVARVTGMVKLDTNDLETSVLDLSIYPADEEWEPALNPEGALPTGYVPDATDQILLTFKSSRILRTGNGKLEVIGDLTLTRVERTIDATPSEAYAGPVYGDPVVHTKTRKITFLFSSLSAALVSEPLTSGTLQKDGMLDVSGSARIGHEDFPELLDAIQDTNWPSVVQNEHCQAAYSGGGEGYSGQVCTGTLIVATQADNCQATYSGGGEGYGGPVCTPAAGNQMTIVLDLKLLSTGSEPPVGMLSGDSKTR